MRAVREPPLQRVNSDQKYMQRVLSLAQKGLGHVSPNPLVGCVIVKNNRIIAEGFHHHFGGDHAEIDALKKIKFQAQGATLYCNLEPCCHEGKTPPCVDKIILSGIKHVVIAQKDPNPKVAGKSIAMLKKAGIKVTVGVLKKEALELNRIFNFWMTKKRPYVVLKLALSFDGRMAYPQDSKKQWITGELARHRVHQLRAQMDAILVGSGTILADDPWLTVRGIKNARQPKRVILEGRKKLGRDFKIFQDANNPVLVLKKKTVKSALKDLNQQGVSSVLVEGGQKMAAAFLKVGCVDEVILHVAPKFIGGGSWDGLILLTDILKKSFKIKELHSFQPDLEFIHTRKSRS